MSTSSNSSPVTVSVIVPMYNVADVVGEMVASLHAQSLSNAEFILIDDGSTDLTLPTVSALVKEDPRFLVVPQENQGPAAARNHGLRLAQGEFICFVDSDDVLADEALATMYQAAVDFGADVVTGETLKFNSTRTWHLPSYQRFGVNKPGEKTLQANPELMYAVGPCAKLFRREVTQGAVFAENIRLGEDQPFVLLAYVRAKLIYTVDKVVYYYRQLNTGQSLTAQALTDPVKALEDLYVMTSLAQEILTDSRLFTYYLTRVMTYDLWPRIRAAIRSGNPALQERTMISLKTWLNGLDKMTVNHVPMIPYCFLVGMVPRLRILAPSAKPSYQQLRSTLLRKMTPAGWTRLMVRIVGETWGKMLSVLRRS